MNIHEAVAAANRSKLSTVIARCRLQAPHWMCRELVHSDANTFDRQLNSARTPPMDGVQLKLFYFISWWNYAWN